MHERRNRGEVRPLVRHGWLLVLLTIATVYAGAAAYGGRRLLLSGHMFPPDVLFGYDVARAIGAMAEPGFHYDRSNVHPFFPVMTRPFGLALGLVGITPGMAAILLNAGAGGLALLTMAWYLRARGVSRTDTLLGVLLTASGATWIFQSALPSTPIFSMTVIGLGNMLLIWSVRRPAPGLTPAGRAWRNALWLIQGVANYGLTVTNGFISFLLYGFGVEAWRSVRGWVRAAVYGAAVLVLAIAASLVVGSSINLFVEKQWVVDETVRGEPLAFPLLHSIWTNVFWCVSAPVPVTRVTPDARGWQVLAFLEWDYTTVGAWCLAGWVVLLALALRSVARDRSDESRRFNLALAATLGFHILLHRFYVISYEGVFLWSGHGYFMLIALTASLLAGVGDWPRRQRLALRILLLLLALGLTFNNVSILYRAHAMVPLPDGYGPVL